MFLDILVENKREILAVTKFLMVVTGIVFAMSGLYLIEKVNNARKPALRELIAALIMLGFALAGFAWLLIRTRKDSSIEIYIIGALAWCMIAFAAGVVFRFVQQAAKL